MLPFRNFFVEYSVSIKSECGKIRTGKTANTDTFQAVDDDDDDQKFLPHTF